MRKLSLKELNRPGIAEFREQPKAPVVLVLDNVRSALNVGSAFRTADAFALEKAWLCGITATPPHREILKTAIGATESVIWEYEKDTVTAIRKLQDQGYQVLAVEQADKRDLLQDISIGKDQKYALVFGNEVEGVSEQAMAVVDGCVEVPQFGTKHSLNIAVCIGIVVWEFFRQWKYGK
ncbi:MAG: RNA methyltransferase [Phaeodactylibacter sp.]|nr:RNA methyltransferase [Phaeodactylibacter sp.]MCB9266107.1 RNA methyltransferase [Lewinellaceae bacterium]MCB9289266.1 RNA methyltransferase [Lewinellaceae bacterium]